MHIRTLTIRNFRTIEDLTIDFRTNYTAICGPNDSGKTNVVRALRSLVKDSDNSNPFAESPDVKHKDDFPKWKEPQGDDRYVTISAEIEIDSDRDTGLYESVAKQLEIVDKPSILRLTVSVSHDADKSRQSVTVNFGGKQYDDLSAQEVLSRIQTANSVVFHNSTSPPPRVFYSGGLALGVLRDLSPENEALLGKTKKTVNNALTKVAKHRQKEFEVLLGKLERKYKVGLSLPTFEFTNLPFSLTLGEAKFQVRLDDWGSGTRNRTQILLALFTAKKISESEASASKTTPLLILEEPECFLHPSAQAEFGRVVRDLADEFGIQVIVTTHSPYMLSLTDTESNVLLRRKQHRSQLRGTERRDTAGENWMKPFSDALGLATEEFRPWRKLFTSGSDSIFLVEGETDKEYFELLRSEEHGSSRLDFAGEIIDYGGLGAITNINLLRFIQSRYQTIFVTYDLDGEKQISKTLDRIGLEKGKNYMAVGKNSPGRQNVEGLLPDSVKTAVRQREPELVDAAAQATGEEQKSARNRLKKMYLEEFKRQCKPTNDFFGNFYPIVRAANRCLNAPGE